MELGFSFFPITLSLVRIENDQISTKSVAFLLTHFDYFSYLATAFTNVQHGFEVCHSDEWLYLSVYMIVSGITHILLWNFMKKIR